MINIGMPNSEVTMPIGISKVKMSREKLSQNSRNIAPIIAELASTARLSAPNIKRAMCGTISPIQPMMHAIVTLSALMKVATRMMKILTRATFTPRLFASSSPRLSAFRYLPLSTSSKTPTHIGRIEISMKLLDAKPRLPIKKYVIAGSASKERVQMYFDFLLCIDDTDELGGEISTGSLAQEIALEISSFAKVSFITRHQLLLDPRINYTSHNSSMCLVAKISKEQKQKVLDIALELLINKCAKSAEPGIAAVFKDDINDTKELINFGKNAKNMFLTTKQAFEIAMAQNVFLKALTPNANGVIGALAGIGLRLSGDDGKIRDKFKLNEPKLSVAKLTELPFIEAVLDENFKELAKDEMINLDGTLKPIFWHQKATLLVQKDKNGEFRNLNIKKLREF